MAITICAHRGASAYAPENTLEAFELAVQQGAHGVELDVHLTRDKEILVAHDERIDRVSDGIGAICDMTLAEIKRHVFNREHPEYEGARAPTLREVYELLKPTGLYVNVELKNSVKAYPGLEEKCLELAAAMGIGVGAVSVKATTVEKMGAIGRREGISVMAVATVMSKA